MAVSLAPLVQFFGSYAASPCRIATTRVCRSHLARRALATGVSFSGAGGGAAGGAAAGGGKFSAGDTGSSSSSGALGGGALGGGALGGGAPQFIPPPTTAIIAPSREALQLYREILRTAKGFWWEDDYGQPFGEQLAKSARREFEDWRGERDPEVIANRIMVRALARNSPVLARRCRPRAGELCSRDAALLARAQITRHCLMDIQNQVRPAPRERAHTPRRSRGGLCARAQRGAHAARGPLRSTRSGPLSWSRSQCPEYPDTERPHRLPASALHRSWGCRAPDPRPRRAGTISRYSRE